MSAPTFFGPVRTALAAFAVLGAGLFACSSNDGKLADGNSAASCGDPRETFESDVFPTVLAALGIGGPPLRGISLLQDRLPEARVAPQVLGRGDPSLDLLALTDGRWRLVSTSLSYPILYDVLADPLETMNVAEKNERIITRLTERWREFMRRADPQTKSDSQ